MQIGSNDGLHNDTLHDLILKNTDWRGIFIEPVTLYFNQLKSTYDNSSRFIFENVAISTEEEIKNIYYIHDTVQALFDGSLPYWYKGLGSFDRNHIVKHLNGILSPHITCDKCYCLTLQNIIDKYNVNHIDLLHIDTEGFDYTILRQINFGNYKPYIIIYEHKHLHPEEKEGAESLLMNNGYSLTQYGEDTLAVLEG
jgi:FkbM family methyltransferase